MILTRDHLTRAAHAPFRQTIVVNLRMYVVSPGGTSVRRINKPCRRDVRRLGVVALDDLPVSNVVNLACYARPPLLGPSDVDSSHGAELPKPRRQRDARGSR